MKEAKRINNELENIMFIFDGPEAKASWEELPPVPGKVKKAGEDLQKLDKQLDAIKAPWTPGREPVL